jgi:hypothetical protein
MLHQHKEVAVIRRRAGGNFAQILHLIGGLPKIQAQVGCESVTA